MPLYDYVCDLCHDRKAAFRSVAERHQAPECDRHTRPREMRKVISRYAVVGDMKPYYDDNLETYVQGKQHRKRLMEEKGVSEKYGKGWQ